MKSSTQQPSPVRDAEAQAPQARGPELVNVTPRKARIARVVTLAVALTIWSIPPPGNLTAQAWHLFAIFFATILSVVIGAFPILTASVLAVAAAVLSGV